VKTALLIIIVILVAAASVFLGRYPAPGFTNPAGIMNDGLALRLILNIRLPRIAAALLIGMSLAAAGAVFQMIFANPLVEPGFLGVSQGAGFGAALCIVALGTNPFAVQVSALAFAMAGLGLSRLLSRAFRFGGRILRLVLAGIAVSALFSAGIGMLKLAADPMSRLPEITFWLLGGLWGASWNQVLFVLAPICAGLLVLFLFRWRLNVLSLEDRVAHSLGGAPDRERAVMLFFAVLVTASAVSISGLVGWIGLMVPHAARRLFGADAGRSLPASMLLGGLTTLLCDDIARAAFPSEIPLGILASVFGVALFLIFMTLGSRRGEVRE
jgi:iron complex transport system permease protein